MEEKKPILVPWDFSEIAEYALQHALKFGESIKAPIMLAHVVKKASEIDEAKEKLAAVIKEAKTKYKVELGMLIKEGSIFTAITDMVKESDAIVAIMGTHGIKGMQKITGSWALKVIANSPAPFIVVQDAPHKTQFKDIVMPIDFKAEDKEKLIWANYLSKFFDTKLHLCQIPYNDALVKKKTAMNINHAVKYLSEKGINYEMVSMDGKGSLSGQTIEYGQKIDAGLILIMTTKNLNWQEYMIGAPEQQVIANEAKIPVMCVNPRNDLRKFGSFR